MFKRIDYREIFFYLLSGVTTTLVNYLIYFICRTYGRFPIVVSNVCAFVVAVCVAYIFNKIIVYRKYDFRLSTLKKEFISFVSLRIVSMVIDTILLFILADLMHYNEYLVKIFCSVIVIVLNYLFGKFITFRKE